jgi:hypothetical protein
VPCFVASCFAGSAQAVVACLEQQSRGVSGPLTLIRSIGLEKRSRAVWCVHLSVGLRWATNRNHLGGPWLLAIGYDECVLRATSKKVRKSVNFQNARFSLSLR